MDRGAWWATVHRGTESDMTERAGEHFIVCVCVCVCVSRTCFTYLSADGHWGCFHVLATVNSAAVNVGMHVSFPVIVLSGYMFRVGHTATLLSVFWAPVATPIYSLTLPSLPTFIICRLFDDGHSGRYEVMLHCGSVLFFPDDERCWTSFHVTIGHLHFLFGKISIQFFCPFFNQAIHFFGCWVVRAVYICWLYPYQSYHLQIFSPIQ